MLQIWLLGQFDVRVDGKRTSIASRAAQSLLAFLALNSGTPHRREKLAGMLWPDMSDENARSNLRHELWRLRKALVSPASDSTLTPSARQDYILADELTITFNSDSVYWLDVALLEKAVDDPSLSPGTNLQSFSSALALFRGELLPGFYDDWIVLERERIQGLFETKMQQLMERLLQEQRWTTALEWGDKWIALGQTPEPAYRALMLAYAALGNRTQVATTYARCVGALEKELGVEPSDETRALYERIMRGDTIARVDWSTTLPPVRLNLVMQEPAAGESPFKGLAYFEETDADLFYGREELVQRFVERLRESKFLAAVVGASGSGKSSFVRAGIIPAIRRDGQIAKHSPSIAHSAPQIYVLTPTAHPLVALAAELTKDVESVTATATLLDDLTCDPRALHLYLRRKRIDGEQGKQGQSSFVVGPTFLVIDQFEELFTLCHDELEREQFVDNLLIATLDPARQGIALILTIRADFYAHLAQYPELRDLVAQHQEYIGPMTVQELRLAIEEPAKHRVAADGMSWEFEPGLVDLILRDIGGEPGALPLLSHALLETWKRRSGHTLTLKGYSDAGAVRGAIAQSAETTYHDLNPEQQEIARGILLRLAQLGEGTEDTRRRATFDELVPRDSGAEQVRAVLTKLADARLITTNAAFAEVAHEALIREWDRLREWLTKDRESLLLHRQLTEAANDWKLLECDPGALYRGARLAQAKEWAAAYPNVLNSNERTFLNTSIETEEREAREREDAHQRELVAKEKLLQAEQLRAAQEHASNQRLRRRALLLAGAFVLALLLAGVALFLGDQARAGALAAQKQQRLAAARELAASAVSNLDVDPERSILLATHAISATYETDRTWTTEAEDALHRALDASRIELSLRGHMNQVAAVAFRPDGARVATASDDGTARVWDATTGQLILTLSTGATHGNHGMAYSPDGRHIATASQPGTATIWDAERGKELVVLQGHADLVSAIAFSPDGMRLATGSEDRTVRIWDTSTGNELLSIVGHTGEIWDLAYSQDGTYLATGSNDGKAKLWDAFDGRELRTLAGHAGPVYGVALSPDGTRLATASQDRTAKIWDTDTGNELIVLRAPSDIVTGITFSPDGTQIATSSYDGKVRVWDSTTGKELMILAGHTGPVEAAAYSPDGARLASASIDGTAKVWNVSFTKELLTLFVPDTFVATPSPYTVAVTPQGNRLAAGYPDGTVQVWDFSAELERATLGRNLGTTAGKEMYTLRGHSDLVHAVSFSPDGSQLATASNDGTIKVWDLATGQEVRTLRGHTDAVGGIAFSSDATRIFSSGLDNTARLWDLNSSNALPLYTFPQPSWGFALAFSPDGTRMVAGYFDASVKIWDAATGAEHQTLRGHTGEIWDVAISADGTRLATASDDWSTKIWDFTTGHELVTLRGHTGPVNTVAISPDGKWIATGSQDGLVKLWNSTTGQEVLSLAGPMDAVVGVAFTSGGTRVITTSLDGTVRFYALALQDLLKLAEHRVTRSLSSAECRTFLHLPPEQCPTDELQTPPATALPSAIPLSPTGIKGRVCEITNEEGVSDQFVNQLTFRGAQEAGARFDWETIVLEPRNQAAYRETLANALELNCDLIVTPRSFEFADIVSETGQANPHQRFQMMDWGFDLPLDNVRTELYAVEQAAFLGGYLSAAVTRTGKVGTFGGAPSHQVTSFMDGFALGVEYYNEQNGTHVQVLGWDPETQQGLFTGSFDATDEGRRMADKLMDDGADIILPVAGYSGLGAAAAVNQRGDAYIIGVDSDWTTTFPEYKDIILTSIEKRLDVSVLSAVQAIEDGTFTGGVHVGSLENGGVSLAPSKGLETLPQVQTDLEHIKADIIAGKIQTRP